MTPIIAYRCVKCGWDFTEPDVAPSTVAEVLEHWRCIDMNCEGRVENVTPLTPRNAGNGQDGAMNNDFAALVRDFRSRYLGQPQSDRANWLDMEMLLDCAVDDDEIDDAQRDALRAHFEANPAELA